MRGAIKLIVTGILVLAAVTAAAVRYRVYLENPWTRNGQVRAQVIQIATRVSGPIVSLPIVDNQLVEQGSLLFEIDPRTFQAALELAEAELERTRDEIRSLEKQVAAERAVIDSAKATVTQGEVAVEAYESRLLEARQERDRQLKLQQAGATSTRAVEQAVADFEIAADRKANAEAELLDARARLLQAEATLAKAEANLGAPGEANARLRAARSEVRQAELDLEFTRVTAPVKGYVTNLNLRTGTQAVANQPALALVDVASFWVDAFFRETTVASIGPGNRAVVTLMSYPDAPITGHVDSFGRGIAQDDGSTGHNLLPNVSPTFEWIRLAQRIPVRVHLDEAPPGVELLVGSTASVLVMTGTGPDEPATSELVPAPKALQ
jgi:multidrug resistance efflux pump